MPNRICVVCSKDFFIHQWRLNQGKTGEYCSVPCRAKGQVGNKGAHYKGGKLEKNCEQCGVLFKYPKAVKGRRRFCSLQCKYLWMHHELSGENSFNYKGASTLYRNEHSTYEYRRWRRELLSKYGSCNMCSSKEGLQVDHILPLYIHPEKAFDLSNGQVLCVQCHKVKSAIDSKDIAAHRKKLKNYA